VDSWIAAARRIRTPTDDGVGVARVYARRRARIRRRAIAGSLAAVGIGVAVAVSGGRQDDRVSAPVVVERVVDAGALQPATPERAGMSIGAREPERAGGSTDAAVIAPEPAGLALGDGSIVTPLETDSRLLARAVRDDEVAVELARGSARFDVPDRDGRRFVASVGTFAVETRGAAFRIVIRQREVVVFAERGQLVVRGGRAPRVVAAGETMTFVLPFVLPDLAAVAPTRRPPEPEPPPPSHWREDAGRGDYAAAWTELDPVRSEIRTMVDLLAAGDVARLSGHPDAAVGFLARAVAQHADDPRAPLAAFTLGRVHLEDLGAPRDAARAFARAFELDPDGPLAEDALAREVEAWSRAGETDVARDRASTYAKLYPDGRRIRAVRRFGGLDHP
jgi:transmembrane sensor